jgi:hypothetical protein
MYKRTILIGAAVLGLSLGTVEASAATTIDCGTNGPTTPLQTALTANGSTPNTFNITGTCVGNLNVLRADRLNVSGLKLIGTLIVDSSTITSFPNLHLTGSLIVRNSRRTTFSNTVMNGQILVSAGAQATFPGLTQAPWTDEDGTVVLGFNCSGQSECSLDNFSLTGPGSSVAGQRVGAAAASASRLNLGAGTISGFGIGVQAWNGAIAFVTPSCGNLNIQSNAVAGVRVTDSGIVKIESPTLATTGCDGLVSVANNGSYGVWASGGGNAYLFGVVISGHSIDGVRVTNGSTARISSTTISASSSSGRSARAKGQAHLYFDEVVNGPAASSSLGGPVCITGNSTVDTDNSATVLNVTTTCSTP